MLNVENTSKNSGMKSPLGFFDLDLNIDKWLEKSSGPLIEQNHQAFRKNADFNEFEEISRNDSIEKNKQTELTSFWLDSKSENIDAEVELTSSGNYENNEDINSSDLDKNKEILQQIRKIMGNLELSDEDEEGSQVNQESTFSNTNQKGFTKPKIIRYKINIVFYS